MEVYLLILKIFHGIDCTFKVFRSLGVWKMHMQLHTSKVSSRYNHYHIILYKLEILLFRNHSSG